MSVSKKFVHYYQKDTQNRDQHVECKIKLENAFLGIKKLVLCLNRSILRSEKSKVIDMILINHTTLSDINRRKIA